MKHIIKWCGLVLLLVIFTYAYNWHNYHKIIAHNELKEKNFIHDALIQPYCSAYDESGLNTLISSHVREELIKCNLNNEQLEHDLTKRISCMILSYATGESDNFARFRLPNNMFDRNNYQSYFVGFLRDMTVDIVKQSPSSFDLKGFGGLEGIEKTDNIKTLFTACHDVIFQDGPKWTNVLFCSTNWSKVLKNNIQCNIRKCFGPAPSLLNILNTTQYNIGLKSLPISDVTSPSYNDFQKEESGYYTAYVGFTIILNNNKYPLPVYVRLFNLTPNNSWIINECYIGGVAQNMYMWIF